MKRLIALGIVGLALASCAERAPSTGPAADETAPDTLEVRCDGETTEILTSTVAAQTDGVHVLVHNVLQGERLSVTTETGGDGASPGETRLVFPILPGPSRIRCLRETEDHAMENGDWGSFEVIPTPGWISPILNCPEGGYHGIGDFGSSARGTKDPLKDAEEQFRLDGAVTEAGYRTEFERTFINVTGDGPKESLVYIADGYGGWLRSESSGCSD